MKGIIRVFVFSSVLLAATALHCQEQKTNITLAAFVKEALAQNPNLHASRARTQGAQARISQATAWDDPQFGFEFYQTPVTSLNPFMDGMENDYSLQQMIMFPGKRSLMRDMARSNVTMMEWNAGAFERQIVSEIKETYAMIVSAQKRLAINAQNRALLDQLIESINTRYASGMASQPDLLRAQVERDKNLNEELSITLDLRGSEAMMNMLCGAPGSRTIGTLEELPLLPVPQDIDALLLNAIARRPELHSMSSEVTMKSLEKDLRKKELLPDFMVRLMYKQMHFDMPDYWSVMVGINVPIAPWSSGKYAGKIEESEANIRGAEASLQEMKNMVDMEVRQTWTKAQTLWLQLERYRTSMLPNADQTLQSLLNGYQTGKTDFVSIIDSYRMANMLKMDYTMLASDYIVALAKLERAAGSEQ